MSTALATRPVPARSFAIKVEREIDAHRLVGLSAHRLRMRRQRESDIRRLLSDRGLNLTMVAARMALSHSYISRIVSGTRTPSLQVAIDMAAVLRIPLAEMAAHLLPEAKIDTGVV